jgi:hypothetical protein
MTNEIRAHSHPKFFVVTNPSEAVTAEASRLAKANANNAKITAAGIIVHISFKNNIETIARREAADAVIAPSFEKIEAMENWVFENIGGKAAQELARMTARQFNFNCAGLTVAQIKAKVS